MRPWKAIGVVGDNGKGVLEELMRERIRTTIENIIDEELAAALGAALSQRSVPVPSRISAW